MEHSQLSHEFERPNFFFNSCFCVDVDFNLQVFLIVYSVAIIFSNLVSSEDNISIVENKENEN